MNHQTVLTGAGARARSQEVSSPVPIISRFLALAAPALLVAACATTKGSHEDPTTQAQTPRPKGAEVQLGSASLSDDPAVGADLPVQLPDGRTGIQRAALVRVQQAGPHWLLQRIKVRPKLKAGRFLGWRVVSYSGPGTLLAGDLIQRVNEQSVERPEQFIEVWNGMTKRDTLVIDLVRSGKQTTFSFPLTK